MTISLRYILLCTLVASLLAVLTIAVRPSLATPQPDPNAGRPDELVLTPDAMISLPGAQSDGSGTTMSPVNAPARPFSYILLKWQATGVPTGTLKIELRASSDGNDWSEWREVLENPDLWQPDDGYDTHWSQTIYTGDNQRFWQVRATTAPGPDGVVPTLGPLHGSTVDPNALPAPVASADEVTTQNAPGKPAVISRTSWGCPDGQGSRVAPAYYRVKHMVVHHTADQNALRPGESNWAARVRATWSFHTHTRGWGDVGYNFLIDPNGVIYEGRAGGDDAVGFHDTGNYGSMGVVLIGTYSTVTPPAAAQDALVNVLAWKAAHRNIDPLGRSYYYGCDISSYCTAPGAVLENISPHRHVNPQTTCPGDAAVRMLPSIRNRVRDRMSGGVAPGPDNGDLEVDELEDGGFARSNANWYSASCGYGGHTYYSFMTDTASEASNSATWRPTIKEAGTYRIYAHIPQGCGLFNPPYATERATYKIKHADGAAEKVVDHNTAEEWVDLGLYRFDAGTNGAVELYDFPGEPFGARKVLFFDTIKWVKETPVAQAKLQLSNVRYNTTNLAAGELLKVTFTLRNVGTAAAQGQEPQAAVQETIRLDADNNGYAYDQGECFLGDAEGNYPAFPKETGRFRLLLGAVGQQIAGCKGDAGGYPWRWGLNTALAPGQQADVVGYVRFRTPGTYQLQAGGIQEYVDYFAKEQFRHTITVSPERLAPTPARYDESLRPLATVYRLGDVPDNLLARTTDPASVPRSAEPVGTFPWNGELLDWQQDGPASLKDGFVVEQTRVFQVAQSAVYQFRVESDDGAWLWVDGKPVVVHHGLHEASAKIGEIRLEAGLHTLSLKYFDRSGLASVGYWIGQPDVKGDDNNWEAVEEVLAGGARELDGVFVDAPALLLAADDQGGSGIDRIRYSLDGTTWLEQPGAVVKLGKLVNGQYTLRYQAFDKAGNSSAVQTLRFVVDTNRKTFNSYNPMLEQ
jgi:hypothetical protein